MVKVILIYTESYGDQDDSQYDVIKEHLDPIELTKEEIDLIKYNKGYFKHAIYGYPTIVTIPDKEIITDLKINLKERIEQIKKDKEKAIETQKKRAETAEKNRLERKKKQLEKLKKELETTSE